jgi:ABC-2 type transport system ATP-binding protein
MIDNIITDDIITDDIIIDDITTDNIMIDVRNLTKRYGSVTAVDGMSITISEKGIYCLLGRNGAGKTTLMKLIAGHINATGGSIAVGGKNVSMARQSGRVNFVENNSDQFNMRVSELIKAAGGLQDGFDPESARQMAERFEINTRKKYKQLSFGMKTMFSTILTLANRSGVILLDEPVLGFDAIMRDRFNTLLYENYEMNPRVIIVSTHLIDEIAKITQRLIIIDNGKLLLHTDIEDIDERAYSLTGPAKKVAPLLENLNCIGKTSAGGMMAAYIYDGRIEPPEGVTLDRVSPRDFFVKLVEGSTRRV